MQGKQSSRRAGRVVSLALAAALALAGGWLGLMAEPAGAAFPGTNGRIAFASDRTTGPGVDNPEKDSEIFTMNPDGTRLKQLTFNATSDNDPAWSPTGRTIAFTSFRDGNAEVYTMRADGSGQTRRTNTRAVDGAPAWSPDGQRIAFASDRDGDLEIYVMSAGGINPTRRTNDGESDSQPDWQPKRR